jgi:DNA-directed RNA polymerase specialized sigma24 family protein
MTIEPRCIRAISTTSCSSRQLTRAIIFCAAVEKMPYRDIAELVSMSERATAKRAERALERLRLALRKEDDHG